ncbi:50S ribosomal protein L29 [Legionella sp. D16C41]|uniref:50S ribosomal protein L29 n=1 Tax=Legionella sp. D16C41 TaxID=3402688 RepID=UPI003AF8F475
MKDNKELRELSVEKLKEELLDLRKAQFKLRMKKANGLLEKTHPIKETRRAIARVKTIMTEKVGKTYVEE